IVLAVRPSKRSEELAPIGRLVELVGVVEGVPRFMTKIHHDLALVFEVIHLLLELGELGVRQVEGDRDDRLLRRTAPLAREVTLRLEPLDALVLELAIELPHEAFERRTFDLETEIANGLIEQLLDPSCRLFE